MAHVDCESKQRLVVSSSIQPFLRKSVAIGRALCPFILVQELNVGTVQ